jgi:MOSC domain-containing protein YiiM
MNQNETALAGQAGRIFQLNTSDGGAPKLAIRQAKVTLLGLVGDRQRHLDVHGGPMRAVCLYSLEHILALQEEGHSIFPGAIGENITLSGLDWSLVVPEARLYLGDEVQVEITRYTNPCSHIGPAFKEEAIERVSQKTNPGWSRLYAKVLRPGLLTSGDRVGFIK